MPTPTSWRKWKWRCCAQMRGKNILFFLKVVDLFSMYKVPVYVDPCAQGASLIVLSLQLFLVWRIRIQIVLAMKCLPLIWIPAESKMLFKPIQNRVQIRIKIKKTPCDETVQWKHQLHSWKTTKVLIIYIYIACMFLVVVEDVLGELLPLAVAREGLALQDQDTVWL